MRRREDAEFLKLVPGLRMVDLNLKDALLRLRCTTDEVHTLAPSPDDTAVVKIQKALAKLAAEQTIDAILLPLALGNHVDHLVVRNAALAFATGHPCAFYEDLPDAFHSGTGIDASAQTAINELRETNSFSEALSPAVLRTTEDTTTGVNTKRRIVSVYASQVDDETIDAISDFASHYAGGERVWANDAWLALPF